jgi:Mg-chelatase subunit ChlD
MKRKICAIICTLSMILSLAVTAGGINIVERLRPAGMEEVMDILEHVVGLKELLPERLTQLDFNGDNEVNVEDALMVLKGMVGLSDSVFVELWAEFTEPTEPTEPDETAAPAATAEPDVSEPESAVTTEPEAVSTERTTRTTRSVTTAPATEPPPAADDAAVAGDCCSDCDSPGLAVSTTPARGSGGDSAALPPSTTWATTWDAPRAPDATAATWIPSETVTWAPTNAPSTMTTVALTAPTAPATGGTMPAPPVADWGDDWCGEEWLGEPDDWDWGVDDRGGYNISAGILTAGRWRDNDNYDAWVEMLGQNAKFRNQVERWQLDFTARIVVEVTDGDGNPVRNAEVVSTSRNGAVLWAARTDHNGIAYLFGPTDPQAQQVPHNITVTMGEAEEAVRVNGGDFFEVVLEDAPAAEKTLDLMFVVDTTGSMGEEIRYLQAELEDVIKRVRAENANIPTRLSLNFYKDHGDVYVVQPHDFTKDIPAALQILMGKRAGGGGDWPEALDLALMNAVFEHDWDEDSVKLMFVVLDAPAHNKPEEIANLQTAIAGAAALGIRIIPIMASGMGGGHIYDLDTEFLCRTFATATGGTFTFLTEHSGVGSGHSAPTTSEEVEVEMLNDMLVKIINEYLV